MLSKQKTEVIIQDAPTYPIILYKYRVWSDKIQKSILSDRIAFMAPPSSFEDKKDCKLQIRYDLMTRLDIYKKYLELSKKDNPNTKIVL